MNYFLHPDREPNTAAAGTRNAETSAAAVAPRPARRGIRTRDAMMLNYRLLVVSDANAALSDAEHNATLASILRVFGDVASTDEVIELLTAKDRERAGLISQLN
jgi:Isochorismatase family